MAHGAGPPAGGAFTRVKGSGGSGGDTASCRPSARGRDRRAGKADGGPARHAKPAPAYTGKGNGASLYAAAPSLKNGFISYQGLRIGVCGEAVYSQERLSGLRSFSSLAIRVPHAALTGCETLLDGLLRPRPVSTLIASPPGGGKTSLLRELIRRVSGAYRVSVIDDRNELSASFSGRPRFDLGPGSDILVNVPKAQAAVMLLRGMNPHIITMDEITQEDDLRAVEQISGCGVLLFATAHGRDLNDLKKRPLYRKLLESGAFQELVTIRCAGGKRLSTREALP